MISKQKSLICQTAGRAAAQEKNTIKIIFPYTLTDVERIRSLPGRKFHNDNGQKFWTCPLTVQNVESLREWGFVLDEGLRELLFPSERHSNVTHIPGLRKTLYPFQLEGVNFIEALNGRALIGDEMRLGKTIQTLAWLQLHPELRPAIIVCPATVKINWGREVEGWMEDTSTQILSGGWNGDSIPAAEIAVINYDILADVFNKKGHTIRRGWEMALKQLCARVLVLDECQNISNNSANKTKVVKQLAKNIPHIIGLSGTPIRSGPIQFYNILRLIDRRIVHSSRFEYAMRYCNARHTGFGWDFSGVSHVEELHQIVSRVMLRRTKEQVLTELPTRTRSYIPLELDNRAEYDVATNDFVIWAQEQAKVTHHELQNKTEVLKQLAVRGKMRGVVQWIRDFLDGSEEKLVVFAWHRAVIAQLMEAFPQISVQVTGSVTGTARQAAIDKFQTNSGTRLLFGNIEAAGIGISLAAASTVAFVELGWTPAEHDQAEERIFHIGKTGVLSTYYLLGEHTIEEDIARLLDRKRKVLSQLLDGKSAGSESLLWELIKNYRKGECKNDA